MNKEIWLFIFFLGMLFFNWPVIEIFRLSLPYYLFSLWAVFIAITGLLMALNRRRKYARWSNDIGSPMKNKDV